MEVEMKLEVVVAEVVMVVEMVEVTEVVVTTKVVVVVAAAQPGKEKTVKWRNRRSSYAITGR